MIDWTSRLVRKIYLLIDGIHELAIDVKNNLMNTIKPNLKINAASSYRPVITTDEEMAANVCLIGGRSHLLAPCQIAL
ncbi:MAG: hypothetical protein AAGD25_31080 [Cyanobacteria bacterium P01_F01_bin.150]